MLRALHRPLESDVIAFDVPDMTCGHCVRAITQAVQSLQPAARVQVDLARHRVEIEAPGADAATLRAAIAAEGYTPTLAMAD